MFQFAASTSRHHEELHLNHLRQVVDGLAPQVSMTNGLGARALGKRTKTHPDHAYWRRKHDTTSLPHRGSTCTLVRQYHNGFGDG
jgi:hypothetical protein